MRIYEEWMTQRDRRVVRNCLVVMALAVVVMLGATVWTALS